MWGSGWGRQQRRRLHCLWQGGPGKGCRAGKGSEIGRRRRPGWPARVNPQHQTHHNAHNTSPARDQLPVSSLHETKGRNIGGHLPQSHEPGMQPCAARP